MLRNNALFMLFGGLILLWVIVFWNALGSAVSVWSSSETYKHCFFILPISLYLIYERRQELRIINYHQNYWLLFPLFLALSINLFGQLLGINFIQHAAAFLALVSIVWMSLGNEFAKRFWFPVLFLGFAVPFGEELVPWLQDVTAFLTVELVRLVGIPIYREGLYLYVPNGTFLVAEACAGIRFLIAAVALGTLFSYLNYKTKWKFFGFILVSMLVPILANGVRAFGIVYIGYSTDMEHAVGADHLVYGWFFFAFVLVVLFGLGQIGRESTLEKISDTLPNGKIDEPKFIHFSLIAIAILATKIYSVSLDSYERVASTNYLSELLKYARESSQSTFDWAPMMHNPHEEWSGFVEELPVYIAYYQADNEKHELVHGQNRYYNIDVFTIKSAKRVETKYGFVNNIEVVDVSGRTETLYYWFSVDGKRYSKSIETKLYQAVSKLEGRKGEGKLIAIAADQLRTEDSVMIHQLLESPDTDVKRD